MLLVDQKKGVLLQPIPCSIWTVLLLPWKLLWSCTGQGDQAMVVPSLPCALTSGFTEWERLDAA